ncbi:Pentatricopeptide repeat-containing protein family [Quillaja saponaria]|uniref:Pentatricopeptide repeat-containing protein family n=1 Tax=Quillaja saponaria TaxID=32244 RepID=A0AAD7PZW1_QUISA|nr:Pentatricopeptide repeat-containing protein family [Quillaja saponaria]
MHTLFPTSLLAFPATLQFLPPLKTKTPNDSFSFSSCYKPICLQNRNGKRGQCSYFSLVSACEENHSSHNWPQLFQISIGSKGFVLGQTIHASLVKSGYHCDVFLGNNLVNLYLKFNKLDDARKVFDEMLVKNTITWTSLMKGYLENGDFESVFLIARYMHRFGAKFNEHTCSVVLQACKSLEDQNRGEQIHAFIIKRGLDENIFVATSLVSLYSRSGCLGHAEKVFNGINYKDVRCINYMILEYGKAGIGKKAFQIFIHLLESGLEPNDYTFTNLISACNADIGANEGKQLHGLAIKYGVVGRTSVGNAVITMYGKHGMVNEAERMFLQKEIRSLISWSALLSSYVKNGHARKALDLFLDILENDVQLDSGCLSVVLDGCSEWSNLQSGMQIHGISIKLGYISDVKVGTALIDLYAKCGSLRSARLVFDRNPSKTIASFNAILVGFLISNYTDYEDPMAFFSQKRLDGMRPDSITFSRLLSLSANLACLDTGKSLHAYTIKTGLDADYAVSNSVITMYGKCGRIQDAFHMFSGMNGHDSVTWNAIIQACALHGKVNKTLLLFKDMMQEGCSPDEVTILAVLQACSYSGLWETGFCLFEEMEAKYRIKPVLEHFACIVDLYGRAGKLSKAMDFISKSPFPDSPLLWRNLVNACKLRGNLQFGILASKKLLHLESSEASAYILVSNMYAEGGMPDEAAKVRTIMNDLNLVKETGSSWIKVGTEVHYFVASDKGHPESREIYAKLDLLRDEIKWKYETEVVTRSF